MDKRQYLKKKKKKQSLYLSVIIVSTRASRNFRNYPQGESRYTLSALNTRLPPFSVPERILIDRRNLARSNCEFAQFVASSPQLPNKRSRRNG